MKTLVAVAFGLLVVVTAGRAYAYPQFTLAHDQTCTSCHISPDGSGMLNENGLNSAQALGWKDHDPSFLYSKVSSPGWLQLGGDERGAAGFVQNEELGVAAYPMQLEVAGRAHAGGFSLLADLSFREPSARLDEPAGAAQTPVHFLWSRQHYVMWQSNPDGNEGVYIRAGHFTPTFGLRLAEHVAYTQKYGGRQIFDETYAASAAYIKNAFEVHATGFIKDPIWHSPENANGAALYAEARIGEHAAIGAEGKYARGDEEEREYGGMTGKLYLPGPEILLLAEAELIRQTVLAGAGDKANRIAAYGMASHALPHNLLLDIGVGHYTQDTRVKGLYRDCLDANVHWFYDAHAEFLVTTRVELTDGGSGRNGGYALAQLHIRL